MDDNCEACDREIDPADSTYTVATEGDSPKSTASFILCPSCAVTLVDEIAGNLPVDYLDVLVQTVQRRAGRREELAR
jgi:hypothetical protein